MSATSSEMDVLIEDYLDGRLQGPARAQFEARMRGDPELRRKIQSTTSSIYLVREVLAKVEPGADFEEKVSSQIISITQSNPKLRRAQRSSEPRRPLTADDPDARLLEDPQATRERRRLIALAIVVAALFVAAAVVLLALFLR